MINLTLYFSYHSGYCAIRQQLENSSHKNAKTEGLAKLMRDGQELIGHLMKLSLYLQKSEISLADAFTRVAATKTLLTNMATRVWCQRNGIFSYTFQTLPVSSIWGYT